MELTIELTKNEYELVSLALDMHRERLIEVLRVSAVSGINIESENKIQQDVFAVGVLAKKIQLAYNPGKGITDIVV